MNSEDELFEFTQDDNLDHVNELTNVLNDIFEPTQRGIINNVSENLNYSFHCYQFNYKKFIYPSNNEILKEMNDTANLNTNCFDLNNDISEEEKNKIKETSNLNADYSFEYDSNLKNNEIAADLKLLTDYQKPPKFIGFKSGSGRTISITENGKDNAKRILLDITDDQGQCKDNESKSSVKRYEKAYINEDESKTVFSEILTDKHKLVNKNRNSFIENCKILDSKVCTKISEAEFKFEILPLEEKSNNDRRLAFPEGFKSGTGNNISISNNALIKAKNLFKDIDKNFLENNSVSMTHTDSNINQSVEIENKGFINNNKENTSENDKISTSEKESFKGFRSGSGRCITISKEADKKARDILKNALFEEETVEKFDESNANIPILDSPKKEINVENKAFMVNKTQNKVNSLFDSKINDISTMEIGIKVFDIDMELCRDHVMMDQISKVAHIDQEEKKSANYIESLKIPEEILSQLTKKYVVSSTPIRKSKYDADTSVDLTGFNDSWDGYVDEPVQNLEETITSKNNTIISAQPGFFSKLRSNGKKLFSLDELLKLYDKNIVADNNNGSLSVSFHNCIDIRFYYDGSATSLMVGDGGCIVPDSQGYIGIEQFISSFMALPNVDPRLISIQWIRNHYQMIIWKILSLDNKCHDFLVQDWVSPHHVLLQLKYRYDKEIDRAQRSALRRISEQDDIANKRLVLLVVSINKQCDESYQILVSDGWYSVPAIFDNYLKNQIYNQKIRVGTKLITCNAEWTGFDEPILLPCSSFPKNCGLKMHGNSTRRVRSYVRLGYQRNMNPFPLSLGSLKPTGGIVSLTEVVVNRIYPIQFLETIHQPGQVNPIIMMRSERAEEVARKSFDTFKEHIINKTINSMMISTSRNYKRQKREDVSSLNSGKEILQWINNSMDNESALLELSDRQQSILLSYKEVLIAEAIKTHCPDRKIVRVLKVLVSGSQQPDINNKQVAVLTLYDPNEELMSLIVEGTAVKIYSAFATHTKFDFLSTLGGLGIGLKTIFCTKFERNSKISENQISKFFEPRKSHSVNESCQLFLKDNTSCEFDCWGYVIAVSTLNQGSKEAWQHVILTDPDNFDDGMLVIKVWKGLQDNHLNSVIGTGNVVKFVNLQYRKSSYSKFHTESDILIFECHYGEHSNVGYISRRWNFLILKQDIHDRIRTFFPNFQFSENENSTSLNNSISKNSLSDLNQRDVRTAQTDSISTSSRMEPIHTGLGIMTSTPKRLGVTGKRLTRSTATEASNSMNNDILNVARMETGEATGLHSTSAPLDVSIRNCDLDSSIPETVKFRRRTSTIEVNYSTTKKRKK